MNKHIPPKIFNIRQIAKTKHFCIESLDVAFSNGQKRRYERLKSANQGAVLIVPMLNKDTVMMIYEYSAGSEKYELALPKGKIDTNENVLTAANRELQEEVGFGAQKLNLLKITTLAPGYQSNNTHIVLAQDLYPKKRQGDEPEPIIVVKKSLNDLDNLALDPDLSEGRSIVALYLTKAFLTRNN